MHAGYPRGNWVYPFILVTLFMLVTLGVTSVHCIVRYISIPLVGASTSYCMGELLATNAGYPLEGVTGCAAIAGYPQGVTGCTKVAGCPPG